MSSREISCDISFGRAKFRATFHLAGQILSLRFWTLHMDEGFY